MEALDAWFSAAMCQHSLEHPSAEFYDNSMLECAPGNCFMSGHGQNTPKGHNEYLNYIRGCSKGVSDQHAKNVNDFLDQCRSNNRLQHLGSFRCCRPGFLCHQCVTRFTKFGSRDSPISTSACLSQARVRACVVCCLSPSIVGTLLGYFVLMSRNTKLRSDISPKTCAGALF